jgi:hypothetical protein
MWHVILYLADETHGPSASFATLNQYILYVHYNPKGMEN